MRWSWAITIPPSVWNLSAGTCNLNEAEMSDRLAKRKLENVLRTDVKIVLAANAGCLLQIQREVRRNGHPLLVMHPMDLLDLSYREEQPAGIGEQD